MRKIFLLIMVSVLSTACDLQDFGDKKDISESEKSSQQKIHINLDSYTSDKLNALLEEHAKISNRQKGEVIDLLSKAFLGTPYQENMLRGSENVPEELVIDFRGLDCFTYLDYVEALRKSSSQPEFISNVVRTRYVNGDISFLNRKHFFTDWAYREHKLADDVTARVSPNAVTTEKSLNEKADGSNYLPGLPIVKRNVTYIPSEFIDAKVISRLQSGDFIGIYTKLAGLDVTHVGFFIMTDDGPVLRNASSRRKNKKVVDSPFMDYVTKTPGIVVLRAKN